jgi:DNA-binding response OmpR family regulator
MGHDLNKKLADGIGATGYIVKPFMIDDLNNKINETLQNR